MLFRLFKSCPRNNFVILSKYYFLATQISKQIIVMVHYLIDLVLMRCASLLVSRVT